MGSTVAAAPDSFSDLSDINSSMRHCLWPTNYETPRILLVVRMILFDYNGRRLTKPELLSPQSQRKMTYLGIQYKVGHFSDMLQ